MGERQLHHRQCFWLFRSSAIDAARRVDELVWEVAVEVEAVGVDSSLGSVAIGVEGGHQHEAQVADNALCGAICVVVGAQPFCESQYEVSTQDFIAMDIGSESDDRFGGGFPRVVGDLQHKERGAIDTVAKGAESTDVAASNGIALEPCFQFLVGKVTTGGCAKKISGGQLVDGFGTWLYIPGV